MFFQYGLLGVVKLDRQYPIISALFFAFPSSPQKQVSISFRFRFLCNFSLRSPTLLSSAFHLFGFPIAQSFPNCFWQVENYFRRRRQVYFRRRSNVKAALNVFGWLIEYEVFRDKSKYYYISGERGVKMEENETKILSLICTSHNYIFFNWSELKTRTNLYQKLLVLSSYH